MTFLDSNVDITDKTWFHRSTIAGQSMITAFLKAVSSMLAASEDMYFASNLNTDFS